MKRDTVLPGVVGIYQFGSTARGDHDRHSDLDICAIVDDLSDRRIGSIKRRVARRCGTNEQSVAAFRVSTVDQMARNGSLFLWHLKREGRILYERRDAARLSLQKLRSYKRYSEDLLRFQELFDDTVREFDGCRHMDLFDLHVLFLVVRNVCMLLTVKAGDPCFGRATVFAGAARHYGRLPVTSRLFDQLARAHLIYLRGADLSVALPSKTDAAVIFTRVSALLKLAWRKLE